MATTNPSTCGIQIFHQRAAEKRFIEVLDAIEHPNSRALFTDEVKALFWDKQFSEEGKHNVFKITSSDINRLAKRYV